MHDGHDCQCGHEHDHAHRHVHEHEHETGGDPAKLFSVLEFMLEHNKSHTDDLAELAHKLYHAGSGAAADLIAAGVKDFKAGNGRLEEALRLIKTENG
jgi:hypothetical protein